MHLSPPEVFEIDTTTYNYDGRFVEFSILYPSSCYQNNTTLVQLDVINSSNFSLNSRYQVNCACLSYQVGCCVANFTSSEIISRSNQVLELQLNDSMTCAIQSQYILSFEGKTVFSLTIIEE